MTICPAPTTAGDSMHVPAPATSVIVQLPPAPCTLTVPVGIAPPLTLGVTMLFCPRCTGPFALSVTLEATMSGSTLCASGVDAVAARFSSPAYCATIECVPAASADFVHDACPAASVAASQPAIV